MMGHAWLKHREALLAVVIILMIGAIGSRVPSFVSPGNLVEMFNDTAIPYHPRPRPDDGVAHQRH
ncbi:L-rhamnose ABC transporter, transmembrane component 2 [Klebsiella pneumoniae]|nr:L-rhamnose ABC transporter, transmembrane component 2 [Klebsiella pneumoniae]